MSKLIEDNIDAIQEFIYETGKDIIDKFDFFINEKLQVKNYSEEEIENARIFIIRILAIKLISMCILFKQIINSGNFSLSSEINRILHYIIMDLENDCGEKIKTKH